MQFREELLNLCEVLESILNTGRKTYKFVFSLIMLI
jgi:hypothetical protein